MKNFESIIQFIISLLHCFVPRKWRKKPVETPNRYKPPLPSNMGAPPRADRSNPDLHRRYTHTRTLGICLLIIGSAGSIFRFITEA